jgi:hypothetical protein
MFKKITALFALVLLTSLVSCSSDSDGDSSVPSGTMSATIDGQPWQSINGGALANLVDGFDGLALQIVAMKTDQSSVTMQFPINNLTTGTHVFGADSAGQLSYVSSFTDMTMYTSAEGNGSFTVTITDVNTEAGTISGTFSGTLIEMMGTESIEVTNGTMNNITLKNTSVYSNGSMTLTKNGGAPFTMIDNPQQGTTLYILQSTLNNTISITGSSMVANDSFGIYNITIPIDVTPGTYSLTSDNGFGAAYGAGNNGEYDVTSGNITIVSHVGNTIVATFNFTAQGPNTVNITNGQLTFEHL